jgi:hypothetical protein
MVVIMIVRHFGLPELTTGNYSKCPKLPQSPINKASYCPCEAGSMFRGFISLFPASAILMLA